MAKASRSPQKKAAISGKFMDKKTLKKSPPKKSTPPKESSNKIIKNTAVKVASSKKLVNAPIRKSAKKIAVKKSAPVQADAKKDTVKAKAVKAVNKPKTTGQTKKDLGTSLNTIPDTKQAISSSTGPSSATEMVHDTNTSPAPTEIYTSPIAHPDFRSGKSDGYQSKLQAGNKSKSGIKPSGKKPLW